MTMGHGCDEWGKASMVMLTALGAGRWRCARMKAREHIDTACSRVTACCNVYTSLA